VVGAILVAQDISERELGREQMQHRLTQQAAVSSLGTLALQGRNPRSSSTRLRACSTARSRATS
jgi:hypothetical protein